MSDFDKARLMADALHTAARTAGEALNAFLDLHPKGAMGMTADHVKTMPEFLKLKMEYERTAAASRAFNGTYVRTFSRELRAARAERFRDMTSAQKG